MSFFSIELTTHIKGKSVGCVSMLKDHCKTEKRKKTTSCDRLKQVVITLTLHLLGTTAKVF